MFIRVLIRVFTKLLIRVFIEVLIRVLIRNYSRTGAPRPHSFLFPFFRGPVVGHRVHVILDRGNVSSRLSARGPLKCARARRWGFRV